MDRLERIRSITIDLSTAEDYVSLSTLARKYEAHENTIYRDIQIISCTHNVISSCGKRGGYMIRDNAVNIFVTDNMKYSFKTVYDHLCEEERIEFKSVYDAINNDSIDSLVFIKNRKK